MLELFDWNRKMPMQSNWHRRKLMPLMLRDLHRRRLMLSNWHKRRLMQLTLQVWHRRRLMLLGNWNSSVAEGSLEKLELKANAYLQTYLYLILLIILLILLPLQPHPLWRGLIDSPLQKALPLVNINRIDQATKGNAFLSKRNIESKINSSFAILCQQPEINFLASDIVALRLSKSQLHEALDLMMSDPTVAAVKPAHSSNVNVMTTKAPPSFCGVITSAEALSGESKRCLGKLRVD
jgi:hypothetical protein